MKIDLSNVEFKDTLAEDFQGWAFQRGIDLNDGGNYVKRWLEFYYDERRR